MDILQKLYSIPKDKWAVLWRKLNSWELPPELFENAPEKFSYPSEYFDLATIAANEIKANIGEKERLREWNNDMTDAEFEEWWPNRNNFKMI